MAKRSATGNCHVLQRSCPDHSHRQKTTTQRPRLTCASATSMTDDYGVVAASAHISKTVKNSGLTHLVMVSITSVPAAPPQRLTTSSPFPLASRLYFALLLPAGSTKKGSAATYKDLTAHPWAGLEVEMVLQAKDAAGKIGRKQSPKIQTARAQIHQTAGPLADWPKTCSCRKPHRPSRRWQSSLIS